MIVHADGSIETGRWHTADLYPNSHFIDENTPEGQELAAKVLRYHPYIRYTMDNGVITDVQERAKTPEEIEQESAPKPKTEIQILKEQVTELTAMLGDFILEGGL